MKNKLSILFLCVLGALVVLLGVITYINFHSGEKYKKQVLSQAQQKYQNRTIPSKRGSIYDRNGNLLATSNKEKPAIYEVVSVGPGTKDVTMTVSVGDKVVVGKFTGTDLSLDKVDYKFVKQDDILAVVTD